jgi:pyruvate/2-oxoglutarate dehydrogenase complex dihydrolipoamide dehydrogenase (E3) component
MKKAEILEDYGLPGVPAGVAQTAEDLVDRDPHVKERGFFPSVRQARLRRLPALRLRAEQNPDPQRESGANDARCGAFGIAGQTPEIRIDEVMRRVQEVIDTLAPNDSPERFAALGVEVVFGAGQFSDATTFGVDGRALRARKFVIATGTRPAIPPIPGIDAKGIYELNTLQSGIEVRRAVDEKNPRQIVIIGGGYIGLEMAENFIHRGIGVTIVEKTPQVMNTLDPDMAALLIKPLEEAGVKLYLNESLKLSKSPPGRFGRWSPISEGCLPTWFF